MAHKLRIEKHSKSPYLTSKDHHGRDLFIGTQSSSIVYLRGRSKLSRPGNNGTTGNIDTNTHIINHIKRNLLPYQEDHLNKIKLYLITIPIHENKNNISNINYLYIHFSSNPIL